MITALFDADGTLYTAAFGIELTKHLNTQGRQWYGRRYFANVYTHYLLNKLKLIGQEKLQRSILGGLSGLMQGCTREYAADAYHWMLEHIILPTQRADVIARLRTHQAQGHKVVLVSGMTRPALELLQNHLGADGCIGTEPEIVDDRYTGRTLLTITGMDKATQSRAYFRSHNLDVDWSASFAYGDSFTDRQMLESVGHPVAVYPDQRLHALALERHWEVFGAPKV